MDLQTNGHVPRSKHLLGWRYEPIAQLLAAVHCSKVHNESILDSGLQMGLTPLRFGHQCATSHHFYLRGGLGPVLYAQIQSQEHQRQICSFDEQQHQQAQQRGHQSWQGCYWYGLKMDAQTAERLLHELKCGLRQDIPWDPEDCDTDLSKHGSGCSLRSSKSLNFSKLLWVLRIWHPDRFNT